MDLVLFKSAGRPDESLWRVASSLDKLMGVRALEQMIKGDKMTSEFVSQVVARRIHNASVFYGNFTLSNGKKSNYYADLRKFTFSTDVDVLYHPLREKVGDLTPDAIGGPVLGAVPIASMYITRLAVDGQKMKSFAVRKEFKGHGMQNKIEGPVEPGDKVIVFEDVTTSGNSGMNAVNTLREHGCEVLMVITIVDRLEGGAELYRDNNVPFDRLFTIEDIMFEGTTEALDELEQCVNSLRR